MCAKTPCNCAVEFVPTQGRFADGRRAKAVLDKGRHPGYISVDRLAASGRKGGLIFATFEGVDVGLVVMRPQVASLLAMNIDPAHRSHGLGAALLRFVSPNWARVIDDAVPYFERQGFKVVSQPSQGARHETFVMVREDLIGLAGRLQRLELDRNQARDAGV